MLPLAPFFLLATVVILGGAGYLRPGPEIRSLQTCLAKAAMEDCEKRVALSVGSWTLGIGALIARLADAPEEVRVALNTFRAADVAVYTLGSPARRDNLNVLLKEADARMSIRGWARTVLVREENNLVAIYTLGKSSDPGKIRVCALIVDERNLVMASARVNLDCGLEFLEQRHGAGQETVQIPPWNIGRLTALRAD
jgi:hypothetical protein